MAEQHTLQQLITDHIDLWTGAVKEKSSAGRGGSSKRELYGIKKLRELILELAVRGKLVAQDPNDEPASVLLERIAAEKAELVKQKKIKKPKKLPEIGEEEKPFELPDGWQWAKLGNIGVVASSSRVNKKDWQNSGVPFYRAREIVSLNKTGSVQNDLFISPELYEEMSERGYVPEASDIMITGVGTIGVPYIVTLEDKFYFKDASVLIFKNFMKLAPSYLSLFMKSPSWDKVIHEESMGTTVHTFTISRAENVSVPIPPAQEQYRIVAKVDELMELCDQLEQQSEASLDAHQTLVQTLLDTLLQSFDAEELEQNWQRLSAHFDLLFTTEQSIDQLKQTILQLAVMGKLVPQDPNDEPASELLKRIAAEKEELVKQKKIKKQKPLPPISDEEKPFQLPEGWELSNLDDLVDIQSGITKGRKLSGRELTTIPYLSVANVQRGFLILDNVKEIELPIDELERYEVLKGDLLITEGGDWDKVGRTAIWDNELPYAAHQNHVFKARLFLPQQLPKWFELYLNSQVARDYFAISSKQTTNLASINKTQLRGCKVATPPVQEQHRIVAKVDQLMTLCDQLKAKLADSKTTQLNLTDSLVAQAV